MRMRRTRNLALLAGSIIIHILIFLLFTHPNGEEETFTSSLKRLVRPSRSTDDALEEHLRKPAARECNMCNANPELCEEVGRTKMTRALTYDGSNDRLRRVLARIKAGKPFTVGTIGGSVSQGSGIIWGNGGDEPRDPAYRPQNMHRIIFEHLHALSPLSGSDAVPFNSSVIRGRVGATTGDKASFEVSGKQEGKNTMINGAQGGTGSGYFAYCWGEHVNRDTDLFVIELAINDEPLLERIESYELLIRSLMDLPHKPAVISIEVFALLFSSMAFGGEMHKGINEFYDVPSISLRNPFLPQVMKDVAEVERFFRRDKGPPGDFDGIDQRHLSHLGHRLSAQLVNAHISTQLCEMERERAPGAPWPTDDAEIEAAYPVAEVPQMRLNKKYQRDTFMAPLQPQCFTMKTKKGNKLEPISQVGWRTWSHGEKHYWISDEPGATIDFAFSTVEGVVQIHYLRSKIFGLGNAWCWVDDDKEGGIRLEGWWHLIYNIDQAKAIDGLEPGDHILHCENEVHTADPGRKHEFRITSLTSI